MYVRTCTAPVVWCVATKSVHALATAANNDIRVLVQAKYDAEWKPYGYSLSDAASFLPMAAFQQS